MGALAVGEKNDRELSLIFHPTDTAECAGELTSSLSQWEKSLLFKDTLDHIASGKVA